MSNTAIALVAENVVLLAAITAGWHLLRQGGGLQLKTAPPPKAPAQPKNSGAEVPADPASLPVPPDLKVSPAA